MHVPMRSQIEANLNELVLCTTRTLKTKAAVPHAPARRRSKRPGDRGILVAAVIRQDWGGIPIRHAAVLLHREQILSPAHSL